MLRLLLYNNREMPRYMRAIELFGLLPVFFLRYCNKLLCTAETGELIAVPCIFKGKNGVQNKSTGLAERK